MKRWMWKMGCLWLMAQPVSASCLRLSGVVQDDATREPMAATLLLKTLRGTIRLGTSADVTGWFSVELDCSATTLVIEKTGYRSQQLVLNLKDLPTGRAHVIIPMVAVDRQIRNRPYLQSEQKHYVQSDSLAGRTRSFQRVFRITDAINGMPLRASACFFFTKTQSKSCVETSPDGRAQLRFPENDIVAVEVTAPGYQTYRGNIIVEPQNQQPQRQEIRLLRELTLVSVEIPEPAPGLRCELRQDRIRKTFALASTSGSPAYFSAYNLTPQTYRFVMTDASGKVLQQRNLTLQTGLNVLAVSSANAVKNRVSEPAQAESKPELTVLRLPDGIPFIYFQQSSYDLGPESETVLNQVAQYLQKHPTYTLRVIGHTDNVGDEHLNRTLSEYRALVTANFLKSRGIDGNRLSHVGYGSRFPVAPNDCDENQAKNRRVTLKLTIDP